MAEDDDELFMTRSLNVTPKTTEQTLIVHSDKSVAYVTIAIKDCSTLVKLTTDKHEASRGHSATAELFVPQSTCVDRSEIPTGSP